MPAYAIFDIDVTDAEAYREYMPLSAASLEEFGARFVVRGGDPQPLEGGWEPSRIVVLEFPDAATARAWYDSDAYAAARPLRQRASTGRAIIVTGA